MNREISNCCKAKVKVITDTDLGRAGTSHYECVKCGKPCDIKVINIKKLLSKEELKDYKEITTIVYNLLNNK